MIGTCFTTCETPSRFWAKGTGQELLLTPNKVMGDEKTALFSGNLRYRNMYSHPLMQVFNEFEYSEQDG